MKIRMRYFGLIAEKVGLENEYIDCVDGTSAEKLRSEIVDRNGLQGVSFRMALNAQLITGDETLNENDELALLPPFAGG